MLKIQEYPGLTDNQKWTNGVLTELQLIRKELEKLNKANTPKAKKEVVKKNG